MFKKVLSICLALLVIFISMPSALATNNTQEHLLTIICKPDLGETKLTEYDVVNIGMYCRTDGNTYAFAIYGYNNFTDKFMMPEGDYIITELSVQDRPDLILFNSVSDFVITDSTTLEIPVTNSALLQVNPIDDETTVSYQEQESTTYYNPFNPPEPTTAITQEPASSTQVGETSSDISQTEPVTESFTDSNVSVPTQETTEEVTSGDNHNKGKGTLSITIFIAMTLLLLAVIILFIVLKRRNSED